MELRELSAEALTEIYHQYMTADFPEDELKPLERILYTMETGLCCAYGIYEQNELRGYAIFIVPDGQRFGLLDYLAVLKEYRGTGVGHIFFELVGDVLAARYPAMDGFFIESENIEFAADEKERRTREKRISFYRQNDCVMTTLGSRLFGVDYSILVYRISHSLAHGRPAEAEAYSYRISEENMIEKSPALVDLQDLDHIYRAMFKKHHYENNVVIWDNAHG